MPKKLLSALIFTLLTAAFFTLYFRTAQAQEFATGVNPPILFIEAEAPANVKAPITLENQSDQNITYSIFLRPFKANAENPGIPNYDPELRSQYQSFFDQVRIEHEGEEFTKISLGPKQKKELILRINIDENTPPGDKYFTVVFLSDMVEGDLNSSAIGARGGIGTNVLLSIGPNDEPTGRIASFKAPKFITRGPVPFELELANHNDYYVVSEGNVLIENVFGHTVGNLEFDSLSMLANSNRNATNKRSEDNKLYWYEKYPIGLYTATANVALSDKGPLLTQEVTFFAFPIEIALGLIIVTIILVWLFRSARRRASQED